MSDLKPICFKLSPKVLKLIDTLKRRSKLDSKAEVLRRSLALYDKATAAQKNGSQIIIRDSLGDETILYP